MVTQNMKRLEAAKSYDRTTEDVGNILELAHVNIWVREPHLGHLFYVCGLGLTRDPFGVTGISSMWINVGKSQFHLPWGEAPRMRGTVALVLPDLDVLITNLTAVAPQLKGTQFSFERNQDHVEVHCPWGNVFLCFAPDHDRFGTMQLGIPYVEFYAKPKSLQRIADFYNQVVGATATLGSDEAGPFTRVCAGAHQHLIYRESDNYDREFWGHHIQITLADFSGPYEKLKALDLITEETNQHQYRFEDIVDLDTGEVLFTTQHETRSMKHPHFARDLINRTAWMDNTNLVQGHEHQAINTFQRYAREGSR